VPWPSRSLYSKEHDPERVATPRLSDLRTSVRIRPPVKRRGRVLEPDTLLARGGGCGGAARTTT
jgi:hypothetical protein